MLSTFVGSVISGFSSGWLVAFITAWISWFSVLRILSGGLYELFLAFRSGTDMNTIKDVDYHSVAMNDFERILYAPGYSAHEPQSIPQSGAGSRFGAGSRLPMLKDISRSVTILGWLGWVWSAIYTPISQTIWVFVHLTSTPTSGINLCARALAIGVSALGLTIDYKARYAAALGRKLGAWAFVLFNFWNATACLLLGAEALLLLIQGAIKSGFPIPLLAIYPVLCVIWAVGSWRLLPPIDGGRPSNVVVGVLVGAFAGVVLALPSFVLWQFTESHAVTAEMMGKNTSQGLSLSEFLRCDGASILAKFAAVMP
jgi:hypothetical protein